MTTDNPIKSWIKERRAIHRDGWTGKWSWSLNDRDLATLRATGGHVDFDLIRDDVFRGPSEVLDEIIDAHNVTVPRTLNALEAVIELHKPVSRFTMYGYEEYWFLSVEDAHAFAGEPFEVDEFRLCVECMRVEDGAANNAEEIGYETSLYPCATVQAIVGAINE